MLFPFRRGTALNWLQCAFCVLCVFEPALCATRNLTRAVAGPGRGMGRTQAAAFLGAAALCLLGVATTYLMMDSQDSAASEIEQHLGTAPGSEDYESSTQQLYQIGDQEYLAMKTGSVEDIADEV